MFATGEDVLPPFDGLNFVLPFRNEAEALLKTCFELALPTCRFLHRPTVDRWMRQLVDLGRIIEGQPCGKYAVILSMFA